MTLTNRLIILLDFVKLCHAGQVRKYGEGDYWTHPYAVAKRVERLGEIAIAIALCHDLFEDVDYCDSIVLSRFLILMGFSETEAGIICQGVQELTDEYTHEAYPKLNRKERKKLEAERLATISTLSQSIKYADLMENTPSIVNNDPKFAKVYIPEKKEILSGMDKGDPEMYRAVCAMVMLAPKS